MKQTLHQKNCWSELDKCISNFLKPITDILLDTHLMVAQTFRHTATQLINKKEPAALARNFIFSGLKEPQETDDVGCLRSKAETKIGGIT